MTLLDTLADGALRLLIGWETAAPGCLYVDRHGDPTLRPAPPKLRDGDVRIVLVSDTHEQHHTMRLPDGDILIVAGDVLIFNTMFSRDHSVAKLRRFNQWLGSLKFPEKIVIAGNHDRVMESLGAKACQDILSNAVYLENQSFVSVAGLKIWGSPHSAANSDKSPNRAFQDTATMAKSADSIPADVDIVAVHGNPASMPPVMDALRRISTVSIPLVVFGHVHQMHGVHRFGKSLGLNGALLGKRLQPVNVPVVYDMPRPGANEQVARL